MSPATNVTTADKVLNAALRILSSRPRSEAEMRRRLSGRFPHDLVEQAISVLVGRGLLDDVAFARFWCWNREKHRPKGASAIRWELLRLGVPREIVEEAVGELDEEDGAYREGSRVLKRLGGLDQKSFRRKLGAHLQRRGFEVSTVNKVVQRLLQESSDPVHCDGEGDGHHHPPEGVIWEKG